MKVSSSIRRAFSGRALVTLAVIVVALAALEVIGYGPIGLANKWRAWRAEQTTG